LAGLATESARNYLLSESTCRQKNIGLISSFIVAADVRHNK